jgi:hypothetical protein
MLMLEYIPRNYSPSVREDNGVLSSEKETISNENYRATLWTGSKLYL